MKSQHIKNASVLLYAYAYDVIEIMKTIQKLNNDSQTSDGSTIQQSIDQLAKAQSALRKIRDISTTSIANINNK